MVATEYQSHLSTGRDELRSRRDLMRPLFYTLVATETKRNFSCPREYMHHSIFIRKPLVFVIPSSL